ncbi:MAG: hypothetical protein LLF28_02930 [Nitrospiraceae bacterium]|nr:hypothetical protein [Nitrospiraceae bacterium]
MYFIFCNKKTSLLFAGFALITIAGLGVILYDDDLTDTNCPPDIAAKYSAVVYHNEGILYVSVLSKTEIYHFLYKNPSLNRAPPTA